MSLSAVNQFLDTIDHEITFTFARSSGPGGQNVNKVHSKAVLKWDFRACTQLPEAIKGRFENHFSHRLTKEGVLVITAEESRDQSRNIALCREKLSKMLEQVWRPPKVRRKTKPTRSSVAKRRQNKTVRAQTKKNRAKIFDI